MSESPSPVVIKNAYFFVAGLLDDYHGVVRIKMRSFDPTKARSNRPIEFKNNFYNPLIIKNGDNIKRFSAVPFSDSELKKLLPDKMYNLLNFIANKESFEQVAFGVKGCMEFVRNQGLEPDFVTE